MSDKFHECECGFVNTLTLTTVHSLSLCFELTISTTVKTYLFSYTRLSIVFFAAFPCIEFTIVFLVFLFPFLPVFISHVPSKIQSFPRQRLLRSAKTFSLTLTLSNATSFSSSSSTKMPRDNNDNDDSQRGDDNNNERRRQQQKKEKKKEDKKKRQQRQKKAKRPAFADAAANLSLDNLFNVKEEGSQDAGPSTAPPAPINLAPLFADPAADAQRRLNDALLGGGEDDADDDDAVDYDEDEVLRDSAEEGMEVDPPCDLHQEPTIPTSAAAPLLPSPATQVPRVIGLLKAGEIEEEPVQPWTPPSQRQGPPPTTTRSIGCQADFGRETLSKRLERLTASRARYAEIKRKRKAEAEAQRQPEAANSSSAAQASPSPASEVQRPAFMQAKRPRVAPPGKSPSSGGAEVPGGNPKASQQRGGKAGPTRGQASTGTAGQAAKDQRVVVVLPPQVPAAKTTPPTRDVRPRSRSPGDNAKRGVNQDRNALPQRKIPSHQEQRNRSASRTALDRKEKELAAKEKEDRRFREPFHRRSPSPRPSTSRHHHSLPRSMPSLATGNAEEIQWMVAAMTAAFTASQQLRSRHHSSERRSRSRSPHRHRDRSPSPSSSSHRPRSYSRKGKGPGRGKGGRR